MLAVCIYISCQSCFAQEKVEVRLPDQFIAKQEIFLRNGDAFNRTLYLKDKHLRTESAMDGGKGFALVDIGKRLVTAVLTEKNEALQFPIPKYVKYDVIMDDLFLYTDPIIGVIVGQEDLNGVPCKKLALETSGTKLFLYIDIASGYPRKLASETGASYIKWKSFEAKDPDPSRTLFILPENLTQKNLFSPSFFNKK